MAFLTLGDMSLEGFESPAGLRFGGKQSLAVHQLIGGTRVIDAMGRDDSALSWVGVFSGPDASDRARLLDAIRVAGLPELLAWDVFCYQVIVADLVFSYNSPWWIEYHIACTVLADLAQSVTDYQPDLADSLLADVTAASNFINIGTLLSEVTAPSALLPGVGGITQTVGALTSFQQDIQQNILTQQAALSSTDLGSVVSASGSLAQLTVAQGYVGRSLLNLDTDFGA